MPENPDGSHNVSRPSGSYGVLQPRQVEEELAAPAPTRVQPSRINRSNRLANIMASIEDDDDGRTTLPRRKKRRIIDSEEEEDMFNVPEEIESNQMAPAKKKKRRQHNVENPQCGIPPLLPLQPISPAQVPPNFPKPHNASRSPQLQSTSESLPQPQESQRQSHRTAMSNPTHRSEIQYEDYPMQEGYQDPITQGWFYFS